MENLFNLFVNEILREIRLLASSDFIKFVVILSLFMWIWHTIDKLMRNR